MLLDLNRFHGQRERVERTFSAAAFDPQDELFRVTAPVELSMDVQKAGSDTFNVSGRVRTRLELACSRCIEWFDVPVETEFELQYLPHEQNRGEGEREIGDEDLTTAYYRDGVLDLTELLREQFQLALPMKPLCSDACRGLCSECGTNLNRAECGHQLEWQDPRLAPLQGLLTRQKEK